MEEHEKQILAHNLDKLTTCTDCSFKFLAKFLLSANISEEEAEELTELKSNKTNQARRFYDIFISGNRDYQRLLTVLRETNQSEALKILTSVKLEDEGKLSLTFKEKLTLKDPGENVLESSSLELEAINLNNLNIDNLSLYGATLLGRGMYDAFVYKHKFNKADRAIKSISNKHLDIEKATSEVEEILKLGNHQNVIKVFLGKELNNHRFIIVMELCIASLLDWIEQKQPFIRPQEILRQATTGLVFLHDNLITHGNLKPTNILLYPDKGNIIQIKLSDFRPKRKRNLNRSTITLFESDTLGWMAPEVIHDFNNHNGRTEITVTSATDVFSLGCLFYFVMTGGKHPFGDRIRRPVNILQSNYVVSLNDVTAVLPSNICIVICMTNRNPMLRPTAKSLLCQHILWSAQKTLQFISQIVECCYETSFNIASCIQRLEANSTYVLADHSAKLNWINQLSPFLISYLKDFEQTQTDTISSNSLLDLVKAIKYFNSIPSILLHEIGYSPDETLGYWTYERFPFLIPVIWKAFETVKDDRRLRSFYESFTVDHCQIIETIDILRNTSTSFMKIKDEYKQMEADEYKNIEKSVSRSCYETSGTGDQENVNVLAVDKLYDEEKASHKTVADKRKSRKGEGMEIWQKRIVVTNMDKLIKATDCNLSLLTRLLTLGVLSADEVEELVSLRSCRTAQSQKFYSILLTRVNAFDSLLGALRETKQSGALQILLDENKTHDDYEAITFDENVILGQGSFGAVYKGKFRDRDVAVKRIHNAGSRIDFTNVDNEINILKCCDNHENIVRYFGSEKSDKYFIIVLELCELTLSRWVREKSIVIEPLEVLRQTTVGLAWLHDHQIIHRDLKPENILFTRNPARIKISDFGLSRRIIDGNIFVSSSVVSGTHGWIAPEILTQALDNPKWCKFTYASDIFALGCVYYFVITDGKHPYGDFIRRLANILDGNSIVMKNDIVHGCKQNHLFVRLMVSKNPKYRPSCPLLLGCPVFWSPDRHIQFASDLKAKNKAITSTGPGIVGCDTCFVHLTRGNDLCSNNATYLRNQSTRVILPQYYISGAEFQIQEISEYLSCSESQSPDPNIFVNDNITTGVVKTDNIKTKSTVNPSKGVRLTCNTTIPVCESLPVIKAVEKVAEVRICHQTEENIRLKAAKKFQLENKEKTYQSVKENAHMEEKEKPHREKSKKVHTEAQEEPTW